MSITQRVEWDGVEYEVKYSFKFIQHLKNQGVSIPKIYGAILADPAGSGAYLDDMAATVYECLLYAGAPVDIDTVWDHAKVNPQFAKACAQLFMWLVTQHYAASPNAPKPSKKKQGRKS